MTPEISISYIEDRFCCVQPRRNKGTLLNNWNNLDRRILNSGNSTTSPTYQSRNGTVPHGLRHAAEVQYAQGW